MSGPTRIVIRPDAPAVLAQRLVRRLQRDGLIAPTPSHKRQDLTVAHQITEALADEIHQAAVDGTLGGGA